MRLYLIFLLATIFSISIDAQITIKEKYAFEQYNEGVAYYIANDYSSAIDSYSDAIETKPNYEKAYYNRGNARLKVEDYSGAAKDFKKSLQLNPKNAKAAFYAGYSFLKIRKMKLSLAHFTESLKLDPDQYLAYFNRGLALMSMKKYDKALVEFDRTLELNPDYEKAIKNRTICNSKLKNNAGLVSDYTNRLKLNPTDYNLLLKRGKSYLQMKEYDKAQDDLVSYLSKKADTSYDPNFYAGYAALMNAANEAAIKYFQIALAEKPKAKKSLDYLAIAASRIKDFDAAIGAYKGLIAIESQNPDHYSNLGIAYLNKQAYDLAKKSLTKAIELNPKFAIAYFNRANTFVKTKDYESACKDMRQSAKLGYEAAFEYISSICID